MTKPKTFVTVKLYPTPKEAKQFAAAAQRAGMSLSEWLQRAARAQLFQDEAVRHALDSARH